MKTETYLHLDRTVQQDFPAEQPQPAFSFAGGWVNCPISYSSNIQWNLACMFPPIYTQIPHR